MATKIRLARHGHKDYAYYHIVVADSRSPRDGKIIERIGSYNPNLNPAKVDLNFDRAMYWVSVGAQPTDTVRNILSDEGVMLMKHLRGGIAKGALTENDAQRKFDAWKQERESKLNNIKREAADAQRKVIKTRLEAETKVKEAIAAKVAAKLQAAAEAQAAKEAEAAEQAAAEAAAAEQAEGEEAPAAEATETPAE